MGAFPLHYGVIRFAIFFYFLFSCSSLMPRKQCKSMSKHQLQYLPRLRIDRRRAAREEGGADGGFPTSLLSYWPGFIFSIYCVSLLLRKERKSMSKQHQLRPWYIDAHTPVILSSPRTDGRRAARWRGGRRWGLSYYTITLLAWVFISIFYCMLLLPRKPCLWMSPCQLQ